MVLRTKRGREDYGARGTVEYMCKAMQASYCHIRLLCTRNATMEFLSLFSRFSVVSWPPTQWAGLEFIWTRISSFLLLLLFLCRCVKEDKEFGIFVVWATTINFSKSIVQISAYLMTQTELNHSTPLESRLFLH